MVFAQLWLAWWSGLRFNMGENIYIAIFVSLACAEVLFLYLFGLLLGLCCTRSSRVMLNKAVLRLLHAPIWFFNTTPLGHHVNRVSSDVEAKASLFPEALRMCCISICGLTAIFALISAYFHWVGRFSPVHGSLYLLIAISLSSRLQSEFYSSFWYSWLYTTVRLPAKSNATNPSFVRLYLLDS